MTEEKVVYNSYGGMSIFTVVTIVFLVLKLTGPLASWSWLLVFSPLWAPIALAMAIVVAVFSVMMISSGVTNLVAGIKGAFSYRKELDKLK